MKSNWFWFQGWFTGTTTTMMEILLFRSICELVVQLQVHRQSQRILSVCALQWALPLWQLGKSVILSLIVLSFSDVPHGLADDEKEIVTLRSGAAIKSAEKELTE